MEMKVKIKSKEPTAVEKRNTAITTFILVAAIPLFLSLLLGFGLGKTDEINKEIMVEKLEMTEQKLIALRTQFDEQRERLAELKTVFHKADTLLLKFNKNEVKKLEDQLALAESEFDFHEWENDCRRVLDDFATTNERVEKPFHFENDTLSNLLSFGKNWLNQYKEATSKMLFAKGLVKKQDTGKNINEDLEAKISDLNNQIALKEIIIAGLQNQLSMGTAKIDDVKSGSSQTETELTEMKQKAATTKEKINEEITWIRDNILLNMKGKGLLTKNEKEMQELKFKLETRLTAIQTQLIELN